MCVCVCVCVCVWCVSQYGCVRARARVCTRVRVRRCECECVGVCAYSYRRWLSVKYFSVDVCIYNIFCTFLIAMTVLVLFRLNVMTVLVFFSDRHFDIIVLVFI